MRLLKKIDDGIAGVELAIAVVMLIVMVLVAFVQVLLRNLSDMGVSWANEALTWLDWADFILSKGTLWLAFLGASLAARADKHVRVDVLFPLLKPRVRLLLRGLMGIVGAVICVLLAVAFWRAVMINGAERTPELEVVTPDSTAHVCEATAAQLQDAQLDRPAVFCAIRSVLSLVGARVDAPGAAFQLIVPVMFMLMAVRVLAMALVSFRRFARGEDDPASGVHGPPSPSAAGPDAKGSEASQ